MAEINNSILQNAGAKGGAYIVPGDGALDARFVVTTYATLLNETGWQLTLKGETVKTLPYVGLTTYAQDTQKLYVCTKVGTGTNLFDGIEWKEVGKETPLDGYATEKWVDDYYAKKSDLTIVYKYKGSVATIDDLPTEGLSNGDVYNVETTGINYAWVEETGEWDKLGGHEDLTTYENVIENIYVKSDDDTTTLLEVVDKAVTIDLSGINERLDKFDDNKQDKLVDGSAEKPHLIWSNEGWTPGKIETPSEERLVPETADVEKPAILVWNGTEVIWSASEVQEELPEYTLADEGKILVVAKTTNENNEEVAEVIWAEAPNNTTITNTVEEGVTISSVISNGVDSVDVYSKDGVNKLLSWEQL